MTKAVPFTEAKIQRAIRGARAAGFEVSAFAVRPDGTIFIFGPVEAAYAYGDTGHHKFFFRIGRLF